MRDTFLTKGYAGGFIFSCFNRTTGTEEIKVQFPDGTTRKRIPTYTGAKRILTARQKQTV